jgi:hypothetical protein
MPQPERTSAAKNAAPQMTNFVIADPFARHCPQARMAKITT